MDGRDGRGPAGPSLKAVAAPTVLEIGPRTVRVRSGGSGARPPGALVAAALEWIDDPVGLFEGAPVAVADLWREVMVAAVEPCDSLVVVHPPGWPDPRVARVLAAADTVADRVVAVRSGEWTPPQSGPERPEPARGRSRWPVLIPVTAIALLGAVVPLRPDSSPPPDPSPPADPVTSLVEGRVAVRIPRLWSVERITGGPGSRRVQVSSPSQADVALHITQSYAPEATPGETARVLATAIAREPAGVFRDFRPDGRVGGRPVVTYTEARPGRVIRWTVLSSGPTRISIGCQSPPGREDLIAGACDEAVRSARDVGTETGPATPYPS